MRPINLPPIEKPTKVGSSEGTGSAEARRRVKASLASEDRRSWSSAERGTRIYGAMSVVRSQAVRCACAVPLSRQSPDTFSALPVRPFSCRFGTCRRRRIAGSGRLSHQRANDRHDCHDPAGRSHLDVRARRRLTARRSCNPRSSGGDIRPGAVRAPASGARNRHQAERRAAGRCSTQG